MKTTVEIFVKVAEGKRGTLTLTEPEAVEMHKALTTALCRIGYDVPDVGRYPNPRREK